MSARPFLYLFFIICLTTQGVFFSAPVHAEEQEAEADDRDDDDEIPMQFVVALSKSAQDSAGLKTQVLSESHHQPEYIAHGKVLSIQPLLELRKRYFLALSEKSSASAKYNHARQSIKRLQDLYKSQIVSKRQMQSQQSEWLTNKAQIDAVDFQLKAIYDESLIYWGTVLTDLALAGNKKDPLMPFISGQRHLLEISLPAGKILDGSIHKIAISTDGNRQQAFAAKHLSPSPRSAASSQGHSHYFVSDNPRLKTGMKLSVWLPEPHMNRQGVIIPKSALFWHMGQSFVYLKTGDDEFTRVAIPDLIATPEGYFNQAPLKAGEELVTVGAQMLLSEEFRALIPDEDDDD